MKEITLRLDDKIADAIKKEASSLGVTSEELLRVELGRFATRNKQEDCGISGVVVDMVSLQKVIVKSKLRSGTVKCPNCTMPLTEQDIEDKVCHSCNFPIDFDELWK
jgi:hypothetical protein